MTLDPRIESALVLLEADPKTRSVAEFLRSGDVPIVIGTPPEQFTDQEALGLYNPLQKKLYIADDQDLSDAALLACTLLHEGIHALDDARFNLDGRGNPYHSGVFATHLVAECRGYYEEATFWNRLYPNGRHDTGGHVEQMMNILAESAVEGEVDFDARIAAEVFDEARQVHHPISPVDILEGLEATARVEYMRREKGAA